MPPDEAPAAIETEPVRRPGTCIRVLIVDDEQDLIDYLSLLLSRQGFEVAGVTDPAKVVETLKAKEHHLVILDMMMPGMSGTEVLEQIRKFDRDIAVIVSTAYPNVDTAIASLKHQASDYLRKPFEPDAFLATVQAALARKGLTGDPEARMHQAIGERVRTARKSQDLTLKQLARRTGLSVSLLSQVERAESSASISSLYKIANALGLKMSELFGEY
ncbi:MAG: response regulator [Deltaproteobacteria bacterium]|nr:response regulator [Deltaproteobacteria bacterium]